MNPFEILSVALDAKQSIDIIERLINLAEKSEKFESEKAFFVSMNKFLENKPKIFKDAKVEFNKTNYRFSSLSSIQAVLDPIAAKNGFSYCWTQECSENKIVLTCVVQHINGHSQSNHLEAGRDQTGNKNDIQSLGSAVSYLKRYTLCSAFGLSSSDDDDGQSTKTSEVDVPAIIKMKNEKNNKIPSDLLLRINEIIDNKETQSYKKIYSYLESLT